VTEAATVADIPILHICQAMTHTVTVLTFSTLNFLQFLTLAVCCASWPPAHAGVLTHLQALYAPK